MQEFTKRQQHIIEAAIGIIAENGIQYLTIKNLARKINVTEGAIYRHFNTKLDILVGILTFFKNRIEKNFISSTSKTPPIDTLLNIISKQIDNFAKNPTIAAVIFSEEIFQNDKLLSDTVFSIMKNNLETIVTIIQAGQQNGQIRNDIPAKQLTNMAIGSLRLLVTRWRLSGFAFDLRAEGKILTQSIRSILTKE